MLLAFFASSQSLPKYTEAAQNFHDKRPTHIGTIGDVSFYEDPEQGDEQPLWAIFINKAGMFDVVHTDFWDRPYLEEALDWLEEQLK